MGQGEAQDVELLSQQERGRVLLQVQEPEPDVEQDTALELGAVPVRGGVRERASQWELVQDEELELLLVS